MNKTKILNTSDVEKKVLRLAWEIYENNLEEKEIIVVGIHQRGVLLADKIVKNLMKISTIKVTQGVLKMNKKEPYSNEMKLDISQEDFSGKVVILIDDVSNSGKTLMYASRYFLTTLLKKLSTAVLIDRNHNLYPIKADYIGLSLSTSLKEYIDVKLDGVNNGAYLS